MTAESPTAMPSPPLELQLLGIAGSDPTLTALVLVSGRPQSQWLQTGDTIAGGWRARQIARDRLILELGPRTQTYRLYQLPTAHNP